MIRSPWLPMLTLSVCFLWVCEARAQSQWEREASPGQITACASLTRVQCLSSRGCTLELAPDDSEFEYQCRPSTGPCEVGWSQASGQTTCDNRMGCTYEGAGCYCHCQGYGSILAGDADSEGCDCYCAGGQPAQCVGDNPSIGGEETRLFEYRFGLTPPACEDATLLGVSSLMGYQLVFSGQSEQWGGGTASLGIIIGDAAVPGWVYGFSEECLTALDASATNEGYHRAQNLAEIGDQQVMVPVWTYVQPDTAVQTPPSDDYLQLLREGWAAQGWDLEVLEAAAGR